MTDQVQWLWQKRYHIILSVVLVETLLLGYTYVRWSAQTRSRAAHMEGQKNTRKQEKNRSKKFNENDENQTSEDIPFSDLDRQGASEDLVAQLGVAEVTEQQVEQAARSEWFRENVRSMIGEGAIEKNLQRFDTNRIWREVEQRTDISRRNVPGNVDVRTLAQDLIDASLHDLNGELQTGSVSGASGVEIQFSTAVRGENQPRNPRNSFISGENKIYACFKLNGGQTNLEHVFVKWINLTEGTILLFEQKKMEPQVAWDYVWYNKKEGWKIGQQFGVKLYKIGKEEGRLQLLGGDTYRIEG